MGEIIERRNKKGKPRFTARIRSKGCKPVSKTFGRKTDASAWLTKTEAALLENRDFPERVERKYTVKDLIDKYTDEGFTDKEASKASQTRQLGWWSKRIGHLQLCHLKPQSIAEAIGELKKRKNRYGDGISNSTVNRYKSALSAALKYANSTLFWLSRNPARVIPQLEENKGRERYLSKDEFLKLVRALSESLNEKLLPLFLLTIATGMRKSEALHTKWSNIDFVARTIFVPTSKNGESRILPVEGLAWSYILKLHETRKPGSKLLFHGRKLDKPMDYETAWGNALRKAGIEDFRWHDNRHTAASYLRKSGASLADIADILGHKTLAVTRRYAKVEAEDQRPRVVAMNDKFMPDDLLEQAKGIRYDDEQQVCCDTSPAVGS